ncbi:MAG TPA: efflux RND transporter periplasmic adaptor subunit [Candidatus Limnocylindrales bacterium]|nr:efflux RND transporter periplasmic adaptor subunit [Candidatus Limnocylindrales bacterium]
MKKFLKRTLGFLAFAGLIAVILLGSSYFIQSRGNQRPEGDNPVLDETTAERGVLRVTVGATGSVSPERQTPLTFEAPGIVSEVLVQAGDRVSAGQVLARLDTADLDMAVSAAELAVESQRATFDALTAPARDADVTVAQAAVNAAQASLNAAYGTAPSSNQVEMARLQTEIARNQLWQAQLQRDIATAPRPGLAVDVGGLIPPDLGVDQGQIDQINNALSGLVTVPSASSGVDYSSGLNQAGYGVEIADANFAGTAERGANVSSVSQAQAALTTAQASLDRLLNGPSELDMQLADLGMQQAELALEQARATLNKAVITAPFDGVVAQVNATAGELPPTQQAAILIVDDSRMLIDLAVDETDVVDIAVGQTADLRFDALPDAEITGTITQVADVPVIVGQLVTYPVRLAIDGTSAPVRLGMSSTATVVVQELQDALIVPNRFIRLDRATQQAFVTVESDSGRFLEVQVELGLRNETESQIVSGIDEGQRIVLVARSTFDPFSGPPSGAGPR